MHQTAVAHVNVIYFIDFAFWKELCWSLFLLKNILTTKPILLKSQMFSETETGVFV